MKKQEKKFKGMIAEVNESRLQQMNSPKSFKGESNSKQFKT